MKKGIFSLVSAAAALSLVAADPEILSTAVTPHADGSVIIDYTLANTSAIVTVDVLTNGVSVGGDKLTEVGGDVNRVIAPGERKIVWQATRSGIDRLLGEVTAKVTAWSLTNPPEVMVIDLAGQIAKRRVYFYTSIDMLPGGGLANSGLYAITNIVFRRIPAGGKTFRMGCASAWAAYDVGDYARRAPQKYVSLTRDFYMGIYPLTCGQWNMYGDWSPITQNRDMNNFPKTPISHVKLMIVRGTDKGQNWPTNTVSAVAEEVDDTFPWGNNNFPTIIGALRQYSGLNRVDLPTHAQWEFACRAGSTHHFYRLLTPVDGIDEWDTLSAYESNATQMKAALAYGWNKASGVTTWQDVGQKPPNAFGLYDMLGNVYNMVLDRYADWDGLDEYLTDPRGSTTSTQDMYVGGWYGGAPNDARVWTATMGGANSRSEAGNRSPGCGMRLCAPIDVSVLAE